MEKNENVTAKVSSKSVPESKIQIIVTDHESDTCVLDHGEEKGEKEAEVNPWVAKRTFPASWICTVLILGPLLLPLRVLLILLSFLLSYLLALLASLGKPPEDKPLTSWRSGLRGSVFLIFRCLLFCVGIIVKRKGDQVGVEEAPILVVAPHSTLLDWVSIVFTYSCPVAKYELTKIPVFGRIGSLLSAVWVKRDDQEAKNRTVELIKQRCSEKGWPQLLIFPEGTNTNGKALVRFRTGAFAAGQPVQPVSLRHGGGWPGAVDTVTWTWVMEHRVTSLVILTLMTPLTFIELEFLPVIKPCDGDLCDPKMFADRVRGEYSRTLGLVTTDVSLKEARRCQQEARQEKKEKKGANVSEFNTEDTVLEEDPGSKDTGFVKGHSRNASNASNVSVNLVGEHTFGI